MDKEAQLRKGFEKRKNDFLCVPSIEISDYSEIGSDGRKRIIDASPYANKNQLSVPARTGRSASFQMEGKQQAQLAKQMSNYETGRKISGVSSGGEGAWSQAVQNLNEALSVAPIHRKNSLQILLNEVGKNENVTAQELIQKLRATPKPAAKRRTSLADWSPLRTIRKINKTDNLLTVCMEETTNGKRTSSESENKTSGTISSTEDNSAMEKSKKFAFPILTKISPPSDSEEQELSEGSGNEDVFVNEEPPRKKQSKKEEKNGGTQENEVEETKEEEEEEEVTQLLSNVAEGMASSGASFENLIQVLQNQRIQDNLNSVVDYALQKLQEQWAYILDILVPMEKIQTMLFVCLIQTVTLQQALKALPILTLYISFWVMIYSSLKLFHSKYWAKEAEKWHRLLHIFVVPLYVDEETAANCNDKDLITPVLLNRRVDSWTIFEPYLRFFGAVAVFVFSTSMVNDHIPNALSLSGLSLTFALLCCLSLNTQSKTLSVLCIFLTFSAYFPNLLQKFELHQTDLSIGSIFSTDHYQFGFGALKISLSWSGLSIGIIGLVHLLLFYRCYIKKMWLVEEVILPHVVCLTWWKTSIELFVRGEDSLEWQNIALTIGMLWLMFFPTGAAFGLIALLIFAQLKHSINLISFLKASCTISILFLPFFYDKIRQYLLSKNVWFPKLLHGRTKGTTFLLYAILVFSSVLILYQGNFHSHHEKIDLSWPAFEEKCGEESMGESGNDNRDKPINDNTDNGNYLKKQIECNELRGAIIEWRGYIESVKIASVENFFDTLFSYLPYGFAQRLRCFYGDEISMGQNDTNHLRRCSLSSNNVYTFKIDVQSFPIKIDFVCDRNESGGSCSPPQKDQGFSVRLTASHGFKDVVIDLRKGDRIKFTASFDDELMLKYPTKLALHKLECLDCMNEQKNNSRTDELYDEGFWQRFYNSCCSLFNFVFAPLITID